MDQVAMADRVKLALTLFDAFAAGDLGLWQARLADGFTFSYPGMREGRGQQAALDYNTPFAAAFSDWKVEVHGSAESGPTVFVEITVHATLSKPLVTPEGTLPATGRRASVKCVVVSRQRGDQIISEATYWNVADLVAQIAATN